MADDHHVTRARPTGKRKYDAVSDRLDHSVYLGRERLGRYVRLGRGNPANANNPVFHAFDASHQDLGRFRVRARALAAIRKAADHRVRP